MNSLKKHLRRIGEICESPMVLEMPRITTQRRKTLIEARIPFVIPGKQLYLPFLGTMLTEKCDAEITGVMPDKLQPSAQQLLFAMMLGGCEPMLLSPLSKRFGVTAMTITRAADQLCRTNLIKKVGTGTGAKKMLLTEYTPKELYQKMQPYLIQPVRKTVYISKEDVQPEMFPAGLSALSEMSMMNSPTVPTWGTLHLSLKKGSYTSSLLDSDRQCALQIWKYDPRNISQTEMVDVLSLTLSLTEDEDERTRQCLEKLTERIW
ncbi:MAG: hypothetical protein Q4C52_06920 [Eubacteriales bacterium]|nr:hypothetical protein [Eubacteriales bacterium]